MRAITAVVLLGLAMVGVAWSAGAVLCVGSSMAQGLYLKIDRHGGSFRPCVGDVVLACATDANIVDLAMSRGYLLAGPCRGHSSMLVKRVAAVGGDHVQVTALGVLVNGKEWPSSKPLVVDPSGRPLPVIFPLERTLDPEEVLLMSDNAPMAFDGRYFGFTPRRDVLHVLKPLLTGEVRR